MSTSMDGFIRQQQDFEMNSVLESQPVKITWNRRDVFTAFCTSDKASGRCMI